MITAIVQFEIGEGIGMEGLNKVFRDSVPRYQAVPGLLRKYYLISENGKSAGGVYLWKSREAADALYNAEWKQMIREKYGSEPEISFFESPVIVENQYGETHIE